MLNQLLTEMDGMNSKKTVSRVARQRACVDVGLQRPLERASVRPACDHYAWLLLAHRI